MFVGVGMITVAIFTSVGQGQPHYMSALG